MYLIFGYVLQAEVTLSWQDNSDNEDGFQVERSTNGVAYQLIASLPSDTTNFTDSDTQKGQLYFYRVRAYNAFGYSGYTNVAKHERPVPISFDDWIARMLASGTFISSSNVTHKTLAHPDLPNLLCYAHGINPFQPDRSLLPAIRTINIGGRPTRVITHSLFKYSIGVRTKLLLSEDLSNWRQVDFRSIVAGETTLHTRHNIILPDQSRTVFYKLQFTLASQPTN